MSASPIFSLVRFVLLACVAGTGAAGATGQVDPLLAVTPRGPAEQAVEQGEPWRVAVRLDVPRGSPGRVVLAPSTGAWSEAVSIELIPAAGGAAVARAEPVGRPANGSATVDAQHIAGGLWRFSPAAMQAVAPGDYILRAQLRLAGTGGWNGVVSARDVPLRVTAPAAVPPVRRLENLAQDALLTGEVRAAAALLDGALRTAPRDATLLRAWARVAERAGNPFAATVCLNAANFSAGAKPAGQPSPDDAAMAMRLDAARKLALNAAAENPPAWSWPPAEVFTALALEAQQSGLVPTRPPASPKPTPPVPVVAGLPASGPSASTAAARPTTAPANLPPLTGPTPAAPQVEEGKLVPATELVEDRIRADPLGQWASGATAGSQYSAPNNAAVKATGAPDVPLAGDSIDAWSPGRQSGGTEWLEVDFMAPARSTEVRVRQTNVPGTLVKLEVVDTEGLTHVWWTGVDSQAPATNQIAWFAVRVPPTTYLVAKVRLTLNLDAKPGWKQIDAVQLVGNAP